MHVAPHADPLAHAYGAQLTFDETQLPLALHVKSVRVATEHVLAPHDVPLGTLHVPAPSQFAALQLAASAVHSFFGSVPAVAATHAVPALLTTWHDGHDVTAAHRWSFCACTQLPLEHIAARVQMFPFPNCA